MVCELDGLQVCHFTCSVSIHKWEAVCIRYVLTVWLSAVASTGVISPRGALSEMTAGCAGVEDTAAEFSEANFLPSSASIRSTLDVAS